MTRLYNYIEDYTSLLLMEKVSKKEITSMLNSTDVLVGAEFEFIANDIGGVSGEMQRMYDYAYEDWKNYNQNVEVYREEYDEINKKIDDTEEEIDELESEIKNRKYFGYDEDVEWIEKNEKKLDELKKELKELEDERDEMYPPDIENNYIEYMEHIGWDSGIEPGEEVDEPPTPEDVNDSGGDMDAHQIEEWMDGVYPRPPFKEWIVSEYGDDELGPGDKHWSLEPDSSLSEGGVEVKSPPMTIKEFTKMCPKMFQWIQEVGSTNSSCGFHIHMSLKNVKNLSNDLDLMKLVLFTDEQYIYKHFEEREHNTYTQSMKKKINTGTLDQQDWDMFIDTKKLRSLVITDHYSGINLEGLSDNKQHIEFRYIGGNDYHRKWSKIQVIIAQYAYNLNLASNPSFKQKEYILKTRRMFNKIENDTMRKVHLSLKEMLKYNKTYGNKKGELYLKKKLKTLTFDKMQTMWFEYMYNNVMKKWLEIADMDLEKLDFDEWRVIDQFR